MIRPLNDYVLVEMEDAKPTYGSSSIVRVETEPVRIGKVLAVGPGKQYSDKYVPTVVKPGDRVAFLMALTETGQGKSNADFISDTQALIREPDVLMIVEGNVEVTK